MNNQFIFVFFFFFSFSYITEPPDCTNTVCDLKCPSDSKLVRRIDNLNIDTIISDSAINVTRPSNEEINEQSVLTREKRAIPLRFQRRRENIKITPGGYIRRRRDLNGSIPSTTTTTTTIVNQIKIDECCTSDRIECKCDLTKCPDIQCASNEYKTTMLPRTRTPGHCCPKIVCATQKPTCFSHNLKRHFNIGDRWEEDPCTSCECSETGESNCQASVCKALSCEKQQIIPGQCCPVCDTSDSKFCQSDEYCDLHCRNGFERDPILDCNICRCAKMILITTTNSASRTNQPITDYDTKEVTTISTETFDWTTDSNNNNYSPKFDDDNNTSSTKPIPEDENWIYNLPVSSGIVLILIAFAAVVAVFCLTCRHFNHNKDKHHLNRKQNTPLI